MASDTEDSEAAADRLETALERIAQAAVRGEARPTDQLRRSIPKRLRRDSTT